MKELLSHYLFSPKRVLSFLPPIVVSYWLLSGSLCEMIRVPGILAGLNERSQSAYAAPAPKPVNSAMGHVRPRQRRRGNSI